MIKSVFSLLLLDSNRGLNMKKTNNIKDILFDYVANPDTWFYWYHSPVRLKELHRQDHEGEDNYETVNSFIKRPWRFKGKTFTNNKVEVIIEENLADFFDAVLDEVRLKKANDFAEYALYISDNEDLAYFRNTVTKREIVADIDYNSHRDHAVHTLYNYLLGWYFFEHSEKLQEAFQNHFEHVLDIDLDEQIKNLSEFYEKFEKIKIPDPIKNKISISLAHEFAEVWTIASLLHDVGYILEGSLSSASPDVEHLRVTNGAKIIHDYFNHYFWKSLEVDFRVGKNIAKTLGVVVPDFRFSESLSSLGDRLCDIGSCENIRKAFKNSHEFKKLVQKGIPEDKVKVIKEGYGLNREAFSVWKAHYKLHNNKTTKMENILYVVERVYKNMIWVGTDYGSRNLDHGVCSGLITLQALTFFRELFWGFCQTKWLSSLEEKSFSEKQKKSLENACDRMSHELFDQIKYEITRVPKRIRVKRGEFDHNGNAHDKDYKHCKLHPDFWFKKILWATAASAIHAIIQKEEYKKQCQKHLDINLQKVEEFERSELKNSEQRQDYLDKKLKNLKIGFTDDPLAFLGVFIDVLQEWDRYKVKGRGEVAFTGAEPLQSPDVYLVSGKEELEIFRKEKPLFLEEDIQDNFIYLMYPANNNEKQDWIKDLTKTMSYGLKGKKGKMGKSYTDDSMEEGDWTTIVKIVAYYRENVELPCDQP